MPFAEPSGQLRVARPQGPRHSASGELTRGLGGSRTSPDEGQILSGQMFATFQPQVLNCFSVGGTGDAAEGEGRLLPSDRLRCRGGQTTRKLRTSPRTSSICQPRGDQVWKGSKPRRDMHPSSIWSLFAEEVREAGTLVS